MDALLLGGGGGGEINLWKRGHLSEVRQCITGHFFNKRKKERKKKDTFRDVSVCGKNPIVKQQLIGWAFSSGFGLN